MSWSDIFYPGNPERRERLQRKHQKLLDLMKNNFHATNQLIETLEKHFGWSFSPISLNEEATVKENCDVIIERIREIQAKVEKIDTQLKEKLEPTLYEKLKNMNLSVKVHTLALGTALLGVGIFPIGMIIGAVAGSTERNQLERDLEEYEKALQEFKPASEIYQDNIIYVRIRLEKN
ncbi:single-pass membrane and coiled-coil domain-containing protein 3-like [Garra rufa]|uniref:single-pass membrane and coiled-coil domain-containing protein 3-like n=1 Tax=Garra rufa TaxID=137080 RepID=UPI003CCEE938